ncbi:hypothetical protein D6764_05035 [Candidatus Woesearchaeota archaeon]|nr:MAG: hypothetical protein D6764_05035 [Candidatus Woesearchaeota archaeon]
MKGRTLFIAFLGIVVSLLYSIISWSVRETRIIWLQTRIMGIASFVVLFLVVILGELRVLSVNKGKFKIFRFHKPLGILAVFLVFTHFLAAVLDNYKWGAQISLSDYLGFSFSDKWLVFLSFGAWAFYFMLLVGFSSAKKSMQMLRFRRWKMVHYFSYVSLVFAYIHSVNLGTDIKHATFSPLLSVLFQTMFLLATALLLTRFVKSLKLLNDQQEVALAAIFFVLLLFGAVFGYLSFHNREDRAASLSLAVANYPNELSRIQSHIAVLAQNNQNLTAAISLMNDSLSKLSSQIEVVKNG